MKLHHLGAGALAAGILCAAPQDQDLSAEIASIAEELLQGDVDGLSIVIDVGSETYLAEGWGYADAARQDPAETSSAYRAGTLTGAFLSVAILQLAEREDLDLNDSVTEHVEGLPYEEGAVTIRHLLTHTSGIPGYGELLAGEVEIDPEKVRAWLARMPLESTPGDCQSYSNTNVLLLGWIVAEASESAVPQYLLENIFRPAGMEDTLYCFDDSIAQREEASTTIEFAGGAEDETDVPLPFQGGGLCTSALDLVRFQRALNTGAILGGQSFDRLNEPIALSDGDYAFFGYGMNHTPLGDFASTSFGGSTGGSSLHLAHYPEMELTIAIAGNAEDAPLRAVQRRIARLFFQLPAPGVQDLELEPKELASFLGVYYVGCNEYTVLEVDGRAVLRTPFGQDMKLMYQGLNVFLASEDLDTRLEFELEDGIAIAFSLEENGAVSRAKRVR